MREGFNLTRGFHLAPAVDGETVRLEVIVPEAGGHEVRLWMELRDGEGAMRLLGPDGRPRVAISGTTGEASIAGELAAGKYQLELERAKGASGEALFGVKGSVVTACDVDRARLTEVPAAAASGFAWPYLLFVPEQVRSPRLLVIPNNSGFVTDDLDLLRASASCSVRSEAGLATHLGAVMLVPLFPRPASAGEEENLYLHALNRASLETRSSPAVTRVDLQLLAMVRDARGRLKTRGVDAGGRLLLSGFSASGSFVNRFAMLHPHEVLAVASGSPGGS